ncbi:DNA-binding transcriptional regulator, MarR family [Microlunatus sagamiharensis]|uniref:DNA-binding transcriptional regulator, MarR family n=1 Tax=Microlunatus sagamiharensis TaxID=546874 RepID=A0A1H2M3W7_9ACTN|nr:MarR family winged helix-turn-helix transcriptional regulator [Microlunatus sagamiharensis]SDU87705.1 DNA-binding transcriptional regulator, MarR family [Microlunatus sagamiharensis]
MPRSFDGAPVDGAADLPGDELGAGGRSRTDDPDLRAAASSLRALVLAAERYRSSVSSSVGLGATESQALSHLVAHGDRGQSELARELGLTSSAATALVDRLERHDVAERVRHPSDRRRTIIRLTARGTVLAERTHQPLQASLGQVEAADLPAVARWLATIAESLGAVRPGAA